MGEGVKIKGEPKEGKINIVAETDGLLKINKDALLAFNMLGDVMCATIHNNTIVKKGQTVAGTRQSIDCQEGYCAGSSEGRRTGRKNHSGQRDHKPKAGVVITRQ